ncbi:MAG: hypothetical protein HDT15_02875 [Oscillibacter sp.]|nr:hypothetical protein [Oscillibacter sp.]
MIQEKKNASPTVGAVGLAVENVAVCETAQPSTQNDITSPPGGQPFRIADLLLTGEQNALPMRHLRAVTDLSSREIRAMIQQERLDGAAICSNNVTGYYIAENSGERERFVRSMRHRSAEIARVADAVERAEV